MKYIFLKPTLENKLEKDNENNMVLIEEKNRITIKKMY